MATGGLSPSVPSCSTLLVNRAKQAAVISLALHLCLRYGLELLFNLYRAIFRPGVLEWGFLNVLKHPFIFLISSLFSWSSVLLVAAVAGLAWINYNKLEWIPKAVNPKDVIRIRYRNLVHGFYHFLLGVTLGMSYLRFLHRKNYVYDGQQLDGKAPNLDERYTSVILSCGITACFYYMHCVKSGSYLIRFPTIVTSVFIRFRGIFLPTLRDAVNMMSDLVLWGFLISVHVLFGGLFHKFWGAITFSGVYDVQESKMQKLIDYFDLEFLITTFCCQVFVIFTLRSVWLTMEVVITKRVKFPINDLPGVPGIGLQDVLVSNYPYLQRLAFYDLKLLTEFDVPRATSLFTLSHPGGYPKTWETVCSACLDRIQQLTKNIRSYMQQLETGKRMHESSVLDGLNQNSANPRAEFYNSPWQASAGGEAERLRSHRMSMRQLKTENRGVSREPDEKGQELVWENPFSSVVQLTALVGNQLKSYLIKLLHSFNLLKYLESAPSSEILSILEERELVQWAVYSLTDVIVLSCSSDKNGVVQQHLCKIITSIAELSSALEDLKSGGDANHGDHGSMVRITNKPSTDVAVKNALQSICKPLRNELLRVHSTFQPYYEIICISPSCEKVMKKLANQD